MDFLLKELLENSTVIVDFKDPNSVRKYCEQCAETFALMLKDATDNAEHYRNIVEDPAFITWFNPVGLYDTVLGDSKDVIVHDSLLTLKKDNN